MLFTAGMSLVIYTFNTYNTYNQAQANAVQTAQAKLSESILSRACDSSNQNQLPSVSPFSPLKCSSSYPVSVWMQNTGSLSVSLTGMWIFDSTSKLLVVSPTTTPGTSLSMPQTLFPGQAIVIGINSGTFTPVSGNNYVIAFITELGNQFSSTYPPPLYNVNVNAGSSLTTQLSQVSINQGQSVSDSATLAGVPSGVTGTIRFYATNTSPGVCAGLPQVGVDVPTTGSGNYPSGVSLAYPTVGLFYWYAAYFNSTGQLQETSPCEPLTVGLPPVGIATALAPPVIGGYPATERDTATITGSVNAQGDTVHYWLFNGTSTCSLATSQANYDNVTVGPGNSVPASSAVVLTAKYKPYSFYATLKSGSTLVAASPCEPLSVVTPPSPFNTITSQGLGFVAMDFNHFIYWSLATPGGGGCSNPASSSPSNCFLKPWPPTLGGTTLNPFSGYGVNLNTVGTNYLVFGLNLTNADPAGRTITLYPAYPPPASNTPLNGTALVQFAVPKFGTGGGTTAEFPFILLSVNQATGQLNGIDTPVTLPPCSSFTPPTCSPQWVFFIIPSVNYPTSNSLVANFLYLSGLISAKSGTSCTAAGGCPYGQNLPFTTTDYTSKGSPTTTTVACTPASFSHSGSSTTCKATVSGGTGIVFFASSSSTGTFTPFTATCTLSGGSCSVIYSDSTTGTKTITAFYSGDLSHLPSSGSTTVTVT